MRVVNGPSIKDPPLPQTAAAQALPKINERALQHPDREAHRLRKTVRRELQPTLCLGKPKSRASRFHVWPGVPRVGWAVSEDAGRGVSEMGFVPRSVHVIGDEALVIGNGIGETQPHRLFGPHAA